MASKKHVLVTGGAGYLGSVLCEVLLSQGYKVTAIDCMLHRYGSLFHLCHNPDFTFVRGDVRNEKVMAPLIAKADAFIPLAAIVGAPACNADPVATKAINLESIQMLNRLRSNDQIVVYPTTNSGYGTTTGEIYCTEETPLEPISLYGRTKSDAEAEILGSENAVTLRLATVFGTSPRMRLDLLVNHFVYTAVTDRYLVIFEKDFKRNYVHIRDVADGFIHCMNNVEAMSGRPYNLGLDSANLSKEELANTIKKQIPEFYLHFSEIGTDPDKRNYIVSNARLKEAGFEAKRSLDEGIKELITGFSMLPPSPFRNA